MRAGAIIVCAQVVTWILINVTCILLESPWRFGWYKVGA